MYWMNARGGFTADTSVGRTGRTRATLRPMSTLRAELPDASFLGKRQKEARESRYPVGVRTHVARAGAHPISDRSGLCSPSRTSAIGVRHLRKAAGYSYCLACAFAPASAAAEVAVGVVETRVTACGIAFVAASYLAGTDTPRASGAISSTVDGGDGGAAIAEIWVGTSECHGLGESAAETTGLSPPSSSAVTPPIPSKPTRTAAGTTMRAADGRGALAPTSSPRSLATGCAVVPPIRRPGEANMGGGVMTTGATVPCEMGGGPPEMRASGLDSATGVEVTALAGSTRHPRDALPICLFPGIDGTESTVSMRPVLLDGKSPPGDAGWAVISIVGATTRTCSVLARPRSSSVTRVARAVF